MGCFEKNKQTLFKSNAFAGNAFDRAIISEVISKHKCRPSLEEAERIKLELLCLSGEGSKTCSISALRPGLGLPKKIELDSSEVFSACEGVFESLADEISDMVRNCKIEPDKVILTGGSAKLSGLVGALTPVLLIPVEIASDPELSVIRGLEVLLPSLK
jgi:actin-like ATPase involved in cell morphogenesis